MNILAFADTRTSVILPEIEPDVILLLGDIPSRMISRIDNKYSCLKLGVLGNHCQSGILEDTNVINMHNRIQTFEGVTFAGFEGSPVYKNKKFGQHTEFEASEFVKKIGDQHIDILLTHSNPEYSDLELDNAHRGFKSFNDLISNSQVSNFFHGHLHDPFVRVEQQSNLYSVFGYIWIPDLKQHINYVECYDHA